MSREILIDWLGGRGTPLQSPAAAWIAPELLVMMSKPIIRRNGALYSESRLEKYGVGGERWHLSWMYPTLRDDGKKLQIRNVNPAAMPFNIPDNDKLPAIRRYYRLPSEDGLITRQMTEAEAYEAVWQACSFLDDAGYMRCGKKMLDFRVSLLVAPGVTPAYPRTVRKTGGLIPDLTAKGPFFKNGPLPMDVPIWREPTPKVTKSREERAREALSKGIKPWQDDPRPTYTAYVPPPPPSKKKKSRQSGA